MNTSSQAPFITKAKLTHLFGLNAMKLHVFTERVGGGFGGKQEMLSEDLVLFANIKLKRPVKWEFTREEHRFLRHHATTDRGIADRINRYANMVPLCVRSQGTGRAGSSGADARKPDGCMSCRCQ